jgi:5-dehydro-2-deoxygluconokinase
VGSPFVEIKSFAAYVGGSPTNMSVGCRRLGLQTALLTAFGEDPVGDFILHFLDREGVDTRYIPRKPGRRTSCVILGIEPPDKFPLVFYRDNCADIALNIDDVLAAPIGESFVFEFAGTNLSKDPCRSATAFAAELAQGKGTKVVLDIDFRPDQWQDARYFGNGIRSVLHTVDVLIGTEDEINAAMITDPSQVTITESQVSDARVRGETDEHIRTLLSMGPELLVEKRGREGCRVHMADGTVVHVPGYPVKVQNILGAGDAFGAGFLYGFVRGWDLYKAARLGNACGGIVASRHGCSVSMPSYDEVMAFVKERGGL